MARQHDKADARSSGDTVEAAIVRRRRLLKRAALLGVPMILTLHGKASANTTTTSGSMSGTTSQAP